jgi:hypothetical protein
MIGTTLNRVNLATVVLIIGYQSLILETLKITNGRRVAMFHPIEIPYGCVMLFNVVDLKSGVSVEDVELLLGEMCNVVKNNYGDDNGGFIGGQVYRNAGFISEEGSVGSDDSHKNRRVNQNMGDIVIVTFWQSFDQHERSHADRLFKEKFSALADFCDDTYEVGYEMLWQGVPD